MLENKVPNIWKKKDVEEYIEITQHNFHTDMFEFFQCDKNGNYLSDKMYILDRDLLECFNPLRK